MVCFCILPYTAVSSLDVSKAKNKLPQLCFGVIKRLRDCKHTSAYSLWYLASPPPSACSCWLQQHIQRVVKAQWHFLLLCFTKHCYWLIELLSVWAHRRRTYLRRCFVHGMSVVGKNTEAEKLVHGHTVFPSAWGNLHLHYIIILQGRQQTICLSRKFIFILKRLTILPCLI